MPAPYRGHLQRTPDGTAWTGQLVDAFGFVLVLHGTLEQSEGGKRVALTATVTAPAAYALPGEECSDA